MKTLKIGDRVVVKTTKQNLGRGTVDAFGEGDWVYVDLDEHGMSVHYKDDIEPFIKSKREEYFKFFKETTEKMFEITQAKNQDYCGPGDDPFANFSRVEAMGICTTEQGFLVRMTDKMMRINSFAQTGQLQVKDESVTDTLRDLANYCILFMGYLNQKKDEK